MPKMCIIEGKLNVVAHVFLAGNRLVCVGIITKQHVKPDSRAANEIGGSNSHLDFGGGRKICSGAAAGWGRCGGVVRPREGVWEGILGDFGRGSGSAAAETSRECRELIANDLWVC